MNKMCFWVLLIVNFAFASAGLATVSAFDESQSAYSIETINPLMLIDHFDRSLCESCCDQDESVDDEELSFVSFVTALLPLSKNHIVSINDSINTVYIERHRRPPKLLSIS